MESGENNETQGYSAAPPQQQQPISWSNSIGSPPPEMQPKLSDSQIAMYYNTLSDAQAPISSATSLYPQPLESMALSQGGVQPGSTTQSYIDPYRYHPHAPSPGPGVRMTHRMPGPFPSGPGWSALNPPAPTHPPYMSPDRGRYNPPRPLYPGADPTKPYSHLQQPGLPNQGPWLRASFSSPLTGYTDHPRVARFGQPDIAGPVVPAGLQALQANNNNATLMQHQHTPMLVPNPHYNQNRAQQHGLLPQISEKLPVSQKGDQIAHPPFISTPDGNIYSPASANPSTANYFLTQSPHLQQHGTVGPIHHQAGLNSPSVSPYPTNPGTPGSVKGKQRGNKSYQCPKCVKVFRRGDHLKRHLLSVHDHEHPYQCGECGKGFASVPTLLKHAKSLHIGNLAKGLMCLRCQLTFNTCQEIEAHGGSEHVREDEIYMQNINTSSKQHCCSSCSKSFTSAANLKRHMQLLHRSKDDARMYCRECGKGFTRIDMMRKHVDKVHNGNPSAMPDELEDAETVSQAHSSESESRGPSADTDESSHSAPSTNPSWGNYPPPVSQLPDSHPANHGQLPTAKTTIATYQAQFQHQTPSSIQHPIPQNGTSTDQPSPALPPQTGPASPHPVSKALPSQSPHPVSKALPSQSNQNRETQVAQSHTNIVQSNDNLMPRQVPHLAPESISTTQAEPAPFVGIEPKSVSEALSMAMKALSDSNYETPGFEMYPYPDDPPTPQPPPIQLHRIYPQQQQLLVPQPRNEMPPNVNGHRAHGISHGMLPYLNSHNNSDFSSRQGSNFLMTMPPPPDSMSMDSLRPQPITVGVREAPQLSRLLQGGGGGVKSPMVVNNNNNCNAMREIQVPPATGSGKLLPSPIKENWNVTEDYEPPTDFGQAQPEEKVHLSCTICKTEYENIDTLMSHIEGEHLKQNPHECCICQKHFAQAGNVKRHIRFVHLRERPFRCKDCSCTFDRLCYLQRHMRTHLRLCEENQEFNPLKPCSCPECGKRCLTAHHLRGHMQRKHFAKNKQNYQEFLVKYGHLEALGTGPGAISHPSKGRKGRKRKATKKTPNGNVDALVEHNRSFSDPVYYSSSIPDSSIRRSSPSNLQRYQCPPPSKIPPVMHIPPSAYGPSPKQGSCKYQPQVQTLMIYAGDQDRQNLAVLSEHMERQINTLGMPNYPSNKVFAGALNTIIGEALVHNRPTQSAVYHNKDQNITEAYVENQIAERNSSTKISSRYHCCRKWKEILPFRCAYCVFRSFTSLSMLKSHLAVVHKTRPKLHVCLKCGSSFNKRCALQSHILAIHKKDERKPETHHFTLTSAAEMVVLTQRSTPPLYQTHLGDGQNLGYYAAPSQHYYGYDPNSPSMVPSPNVQAAYVAPAHYAASQMPLIQT